MARLRNAVLALSLAALACNSLLPPRPEVAWDPSPEAVVVRATNCCGLTPIQFVMNYIPDMTAWGDGRLIWVQTGSDGERRVLEGRLTEAEMKALLQRFVDAGFFGWEASYADYSVTDMPSQCLVVNLEVVGKSVCEYYRGAPAAFDRLYAEAARGAGAAGVDFVPERAYLTAYPLESYSPPDPGAIPHWPAAAGFTLAEAQAGRWVEGEALQVAWAAVNASVWSSFLQEDGAYYQVAVQVPGLSWSEPPEK
jgi:hypothetical protein